MSNTASSGEGPVIRASALGKSYGDTVAVRDLSFEVHPGEVLGLLGPNGAGKTTTVDILTTLQPADSGSASVAGCDVRRQPRGVRRAIGLAGQSAAVDEMLTARENLTLFGRLYKLPRRAIAARTEELVETFRLGEFADRPAGTYSGGQRRRLDVAAALVADPPALFLDEPTAGLDPRSRADLWQAVERLAAAGTAIVLTTQYLEEADRLADRIVIIDQGAEVASGTPAQLKHQVERDVLEVSLASEERAGRALALLADRGASRTGAGRIHVPVTDGAATALGALRLLQDSGVEVSDFQLRRPTLDDVFLTLTALPGETGAAPTSRSAA